MASNIHVVIRTIALRVLNHSQVLYSYVQYTNSFCYLTYVAKSTVDLPLPIYICQPYRTPTPSLPE